MGKKKELKPNVVFLTDLMSVIKLRRVRASFESSKNLPYFKGSGKEDFTVITSLEPSGYFNLDKVMYVELALHKDFIIKTFSNKDHSKMTKNKIKIKTSNPNDELSKVRIPIEIFELMTIQGDFSPANTLKYGYILDKNKERIATLVYHGYRI